MPGYSTSESSGYSTSTPVQSPQSQWGLQLSQLLTAIGQNQYNWALNQYAQGQQVTDANIDNFLRMSGNAEGLTRNLMSQYQNVVQPLMNKFISDAGSYNSEARQRFNMGQAESTVAQADQHARDAAERNLQSFGINPNSGRYQDLMLTSRIQDAAARAGAGTQASVNTAATGRQMEQTALQMGQNVPGMAVNAGTLANASTTGAQNAELGLLNTGANLTSSAAPFFNAASGAIKMPTNATNSKQQSTGRSVQTPQLPPPSQPQSDRGGQSSPSRSAPNYNDGDRGKAWMPQHGDAQEKFGGPKNYSIGQGAGPHIMTKGDGQDTGEREQYGPLNEYGPWLPDDLRQQMGEDNTGTSTIGDWTQNQRGLDPDLGGASRSNGMDQDWDTGNTTRTGVTDQNLPSDPMSWNANRQNPNQQGVDPWVGVQNPDTWGQGTSPFDYGNNQWGGQLGQEDNAYNPQDYMGQYGQGQQGSGNWDTGNQGGGQQDNTDWGDWYTNQNSGGGENYGGTDYSGDYGGGYASGGPVHQRTVPTSGGPVPRSASPSQGQVIDDVPARLNAGEFVIPRDVTSHLGTQHFHKLIEKSRMARTGMKGPAARPTMRPAMQARPTFTSRPMGA